MNKTTDGTKWPAQDKVENVMSTSVLEKVFLTKNNWLYWMPPELLS